MEEFGKVIWEKERIELDRGMKKVGTS